MSLFDDAAAFMKNRQPETKSDTDSREQLIKKLRAEFENATRLEVERALDKLAAQDGIPDDFDLLLKKVRIWLED